jgi:hypothetical protein
MDTIALLGALEHIAIEVLKLPGVALGHALVAAQQVYAQRHALVAERDTCPCGRKLSECVFVPAAVAGANA